MKKPIRVVTIGGGTGTYPVIQALRKLTPHIVAVVAASDSGGSTGRIRDEFGFVPVGDLRQSLAALAVDKNQQWISRLLLYRFEKGTGLKGHNLGNLILTALQDMTGSTTNALDVAQAIFQLVGKVVPVTENIVQLVVHYHDGSTKTGEHHLDETHPKNKIIDHVSLTPKAQINSQAKEAISWAETLVIGPGDYYASIMAVLVTPGMQKLIKNFPGKIVYITNLMTRATQTNHMTAKDHVSGIEKVIGRKVDRVVVNQEKIPEEILLTYQAADEHPILDDLLEDNRVYRANLVNKVKSVKSKNDTAHRSLLRHDARKLEKVFSQILFE